MPGRLKHTLLPLMVSALAFLTVPSGADETNVLGLLKRPGVHAIMRHALAPGTGDPVDFRLDDCSTQRNLNSRGRNQARAVGQAFKDAGVTFDRVLTSQWCRCRETANLLNLGQPVDFPALNSFFRDRSTSNEQTKQVRTFLNSLSEREKVLLVTHQVNISALSGRGVASGEVFLIKRNEVGKVEVVGEFLLPP